MLNSQNETLNMISSDAEDMMARLELPGAKSGKPLIPSTQSLDKYVDSRISIQDSPTASLNCESMLNHQDPRLEMELGLENSRDSDQNFDDLDNYENPDQSGSFSSLSNVDSSPTKSSKQKNEYVNNGQSGQGKNGSGGKKKASSALLDRAKKPVESTQNPKSTSLKTLIDAYQPEEIIKEASIHEENETSSPMKKQEKIMEVKSLLEFSRSMKSRKGNDKDKGIFGSFNMKELREFLKQNP